MRENRPSGLMRGGAQAVIGICLSTRRPRLLYTVMESGSEILKVDEVGRVQTPPERGEAMLAEYDGSVVRAVRRSEVFDANVLLQKHRKQAGQEEKIASSLKDHPRWLEARVEGELSPSEKLVVEMRGGVRMLVSNRTISRLLF